MDRDLLSAPSPPNRFRCGCGRVAPTVLCECGWRGCAQCVSDCLYWHRTFDPLEDDPEARRNFRAEQMP